MRPDLKGPSGDRRSGMSRLALISDIHGNAVALDAVLADLARLGVEQIVCLGDLAAGGPQPRKVIARLRELRCLAVRGNADGWLLEGLPAGRSEETRRLDDVVAWARARLAPEDVEHLAALPPTLTVTAGGVTVLCFHGSPRSDVESLLATTSEHELDQLFGAAEVGVLAGGHTHLQLLRRHRDRILVNPGSVGLPLGSLTSLRGAPPLPAWAEYVLVEDDGRLEISFRRLPVDLDALAAATESMPCPSWAADLERRIRRWNARAR
jgi:putative phosphoesterase